MNIDHINLLEALKGEQKPMDEEKREVANESHDKTNMRRG